MRTDTTATGRTVWPAILILSLVAGIAGAASLMLSWAGIRDMIARVEGVHGWLSLVGPAGIDGLQLASLVAIIVTTGAPYAVRLYLWSVFFASIGVSVVMNAADASARGIGPEGVILSGLWPALLAASTHVVVVAVRWLRSDRRPVYRLSEASDRVPSAPHWSLADVPVSPAVFSDVDPVSPAPPPGWDMPSAAFPAVEISGPTQAQLRAWARASYKTTHSAATTGTRMRAKGYEVSDKQVERWTVDLRPVRQRAADEDGLDASLATLAG